MTRIKVDPDQLQAVAQQLWRATDTLDQIQASIGNASYHIGSEHFSYNHRARIEGSVRNAISRAAHAESQARLLAKSLEESAHRFEQADGQEAGWLSGLISDFLGSLPGGILPVILGAGGMLWSMGQIAGSGLASTLKWVGTGSDFVSSGSVKGASTTAIFTIAGTINVSTLPNFEDMSWAERFAWIEKLDEKISNTESALKKLGVSIEEEKTKIEDIDKSLAQLRAEREDLQEKANDWKNKIKFDEDGLSWGLDDKFPDAPWRTRSDDYEDQLAELDKQIASLEEQKNIHNTKLQGFNAQQNNLNQDLRTFREGQSELQNQINQGVVDGPTESGLRKSLGGCVHYVAEKRNVTAFGNGHPGNASKWLQQAKDANFDTGKVPIKGAILYYKPGYKGKYSTIGQAGHVGYVESVTRVDGGYQVKFSQANTIRGDQYPNGWKRGDHTPPSTSAKFIPDGGEDGISFIYDKL